MDVSETITPNSQQVNAEDLIAAPRVVTVTGVEKGTAEQPVFIHTPEFPSRTYRPAKSMRRVLAVVWGVEADKWVGRRMELFNDTSVKWAGQEVGGVRISRMSHIDKPRTIQLTVARGKRAPFTVNPLPDDEKTVSEVIGLIESATSLPALKVAWELAGKRGVQSDPRVVAAKESGKGRLS